MVIRNLSILVFLSLFICVFSVSCSQRNGEPQPSLVDNEPAEAYEIPENAVYQDAPVYNVPVKNIADSDVIVREIKIPDKVDYEHGTEYLYNFVNVLNIIDDSHVLLKRGRSDSQTADLVVYNYLTGEWGEPMNAGEEYYDFFMTLMYVDKNYCVVSTSSEWGMGVGGTLVLFDMKNQTAETIFEFYPDGDNTAITGYHANNIVVFEEQVYFDDYRNGKDTSTLYAYDIESSDLRVVSENAMNPIVYKDEVWFFTPNQGGVYTILQSENSGETLENAHQIGALVSVNEKLFTTRSMGEDETLKTSLVGVFEWGGDTAIAESRRGNVIFNLKANRDFISWSTSMEHQKPCIYDIADNILYEFGDEYFDNDDYYYNFYLNGNVGLFEVFEHGENGEGIGNGKYFLFQKT